MNLYFLAVLGLSRGMQYQFPDEGLNLGSFHWEFGVLATGPPGKPPYEWILNNIILCEKVSSKTSDIQMMPP